MAHLPKVSIIIPTYNRALLLKKAIESVLKQTFKDYEIIVVDDGSTDNTREIVHSYSLPKIKYIYQENKGRSNARNKALKIAKGQYIAYLDSDDMFLPDKLERQISILEVERDVGMVYTSARVFDEDDNELFRQDKLGNKRLYYEATDSGWIYNKVAFYFPQTIILPSVMVRSEIQKKVGDFDENLDRFEDTDMWRRISKECKIFAIKEPLCIIRQHSDNKMENPKDVFKSMMHYINKIFSEDRNVSCLTKRKGASKLLFYYGAVVFVKNDYKKNFSFPFFIQSLKSWPPYPISIFFRLLFSKRRDVALKEWARS